MKLSAHAYICRVTRFLTNIAIILLVPVILWKTCSSGVIYVRYIIRKEYVAQTFCVNKDKPKMQCDGKCLREVSGVGARKEQTRKY